MNNIKLLKLEYPYNNLFSSLLKLYNGLLNIREE